MSDNMNPLIFDTSDGQELRINTINTYLKNQFGSKVVKLSLDGGFTCPNRDGSKGVGGCLFCSASGSGDMAAGSGDIFADLDNQIKLLTDKWPEAQYLAYFQSHTNTYAPVDELRQKFYAALEHPKVCGIAIATLLGHLLDVPVVFAKKSETANCTDDKYVAQAYSFTHRRHNSVFVSRPYLTADDRVLIVDDFLADGQAAHALIDLVRQAGGQVWA